MSLCHTPCHQSSTPQLLPSHWTASCVMGTKTARAPWSYLIMPPVTRTSKLVPPPACTQHHFCVAHKHTRTHKPPISIQRTPLCTSWQLAEMFSSCEVPAVIVREQRIQQNNNHMIRNVGYVKAVRIKLFGFLLTRSFIYCFHFVSRWRLAQYLNCSVTLTEN